MDCAGALGRAKADRLLPSWQFWFYSFTRSSDYLVDRHAAVHRNEYERALSQPFSRSSSAEAAARGRVFSLLGRREEARQSYDAAKALDSGNAAAWAWDWEDRFFREWKRDFAGIDRAIALEPRRALWYAMRGTAKVGDLDEVSLKAAHPRADLEKALKLDSNCLQALISHGVVSLEIGDLRAAEDSFNRAIKIDPRPSFFYAYRARCRLMQGDQAGFAADCETAVYANEELGYFEWWFEGKGNEKGMTLPQRIDLITRYLTGAADDYWKYVYRGDFRRSPQINDYVGGLRDLEKAVELKPDCAYAWAYLSRARLMHADSKQAMIAADRSVALKASCGWLWIWRGEIKRRLGDSKGALADFDRGIRLDPDYELGYSWRGGAWLSLGRVEEALADLTTAKAFDPRHAWTLQERSSALRRLGRTKEALAELTQAHRLDPKFVWCGKPAFSAAAAAELDAEIRREPGNSWAWAWRGDTKLRIGDPRGAIRDLTRAISLDPGQGLPRAWRGRVFQKLGQLGRAAADFNAALALEPRYGHALAWRGRARHARGNWAAALSDFKRAVECDQKSSWIYQWKADTETQLRRWKEAEEDYDRALGIDPRNVEAMSSRAQVRARRRDLSGARRDLEQAERLAPDDARVKFALGTLGEAEGRWAEARGCHAAALKSMKSLTAEERVHSVRFLKRGPRVSTRAVARALRCAERYSSEGRHDLAAANCEEILRAGESRPALRLLAEAFRCLGEYEQSVAAHDRLVRLLPRSPSSWLDRSMARRNHRDFPGALRDARKALRLGGADPSAAHLAESEALRNLGRMPEAVESASRAIAARPRDEWAYVVRGKARRQSGDWAGALADYRRAVKLNAKNAKAHGWWAESLRKAGRREEALERIKIAEALLPTCAWIVALRGEIERDLGRFKQCAERIDKAVALDPNGSCAHDFIGADPPQVFGDVGNAWIYAWRGAVARRKENWREARRDLGRAVELDPGCFWARGWLGELLLAQGDHGGAMEQLAQAHRIFPDYADAWIWRGRSLGELGRWSDALRCYRKAYALDTRSPWAAIGISVSLERLGRGVRAAKYMNDARRLAPGLFAATGSGPA